MTTIRSLDGNGHLDQRLRTGPRDTAPIAAPVAAPVIYPAGVPLAATSVEGELRHVGAWSAAKVVAVLAFLVAAAWTVGILLCWLAADALGATRQVERLARDLGFEGFRLAATPVFAGIALLGLAFIATCTVAALIAAAAFNVVVRIVGGVRVTIATDDALTRSGG